MKRTRTVPVVFSIFAVVGVWYLFAERAGSALVLPYPHDVVRRLFELARTRNFYAMLGETVMRTVWAFLLSALLSLLLGVLSGVSAFFSRFLRFPLSLIKATPVVSFILLASFWFTSGTVPIFVSVLMTLPVMTAAVASGVKGTDKKLVAMARVYGFTNVQKLRYLYIPSMKPYFISGALSSLGLTWKVVVAGEILTLPKRSVGAALQTAKVHLETVDVFAWTLAVVTLSFCCELLFARSVHNEKKPRKPRGKRNAKSKLILQSAPPNAQSERIVQRECNERPVAPFAQSELILQSAPPNAQSAPPDATAVTADATAADASSASAPAMPAASANVDVSIQNLSVTRGTKELYRNFSLCFKANTVTAILAPSGAGKTTLLDCIAGLLTPNAGGVTFTRTTGADCVQEGAQSACTLSNVAAPTNGAPNTHDATSDIRAPSTAYGTKNMRKKPCPCRVSYLFQEPRLLPWCTLIKNCMLPLEPFLSKAESERTALLFLERVGLKERAFSYPDELSGGEKQRAALARAFAYDAPVLLMDEAFQSQDIGLKQQLMELLRTLNGKNPRTTLMVTHDIREALMLADRIVVLKSDARGEALSVRLDVTVKDQNPVAVRDEILRILS